jgi:mannosyltransferase OCH1-like enzyme
MIPRIVHYIWLGGIMPNKNKKILERNNFFLRGFKIYLWTEKNLDLSAPYVKKAYKAKKWAFASDYLRFEKLYTYGGIYLDCDMELVRDISDLLEFQGFAANDKTGSYIYCGAIGSERNNSLIRNILIYYNNIENDSWQTSPVIFTKIYNKSAKNKFKILPFFTFYPFSKGEKINNLQLSRAYGVHHWDESWRSFKFLRSILRYIGFIKLYHRIVK